MPPPPPALLQQAIDEMQSLIGALEHSDSPASTLAILCCHTQSLHRLLEQAGCSLLHPGSAALTDSETNRSVSGYIEHLGRLRAHLQDASRQLHAWQRELDAERNRLRNLARWAVAAQGTEP